MSVGDLLLRQRGWRVFLSDVSTANLCYRSRLMWRRVAFKTLDLRSTLQPLPKQGVLWFGGMEWIWSLNKLIASLCIDMYKLASHKLYTYLALLEVELSPLPWAVEYWRSDLSFWNGAPQRLI